MGFQLVIWSHYNYYGRKFDKASTLSLRVQHNLNTRRIAPSLRMWWGGWDGWTGYHKFPSIFFILCGYIYRVCILIYSQKLLSTFIWVSIFDVKLGSGGKIFKITILTWFFKNHAKSKVFQKHLRQQAFFKKFDVRLGSSGIISKITIFTWFFKNHAKSMGVQLVFWSHYN